MTQSFSEKLLSTWNDTFPPLNLFNYKMISEIDIKDMQPDFVNHPPHYTNHPSGVECIQITEHMNFLLGNAMKYIWRADLKNGKEDIEKAIWYLQRELAKR